MTTKTWTIPSNRMKSGREHRVPLNDECLEILSKLEKYKSASDGMVFGQKLSDVAASKAIKIVSYPILKLLCMAFEAHFAIGVGTTLIFQEKYVKQR